MQGSGSVHGFVFGRGNSIIYLFVVDGEWVFDRRATDYTPNVFEGMNAVVRVQAPPVTAARPALRRSTLLAVQRAKHAKPPPKLVECSCDSARIKKCDDRNSVNKQTNKQTNNSKTKRKVRT